MSSRTKKPTPLSGFPEWLPAERLVEQYVLDHLRSVFELHGFAPVQTRAVEPLEWLLSKGETDKEIYLLQRLQAEAEPSGSGGPGGPGDPGTGDKDFGLHFDLTVPFARYVLENAGKLQFPFRRYQIQPVWRGERPQEGRYREFIQADIDVVDRDRLSFQYEVELPLVIAEALGGLPLPGGFDPPITILTNNRKISEGFYRGLGITDVTGVLRAVDKLDKIGADAVVDLLTETVGCSKEQADACVRLARITTTDDSFTERVAELGVRHELLDQGLEELARVVRTAAEHAPGLLVADLRIARGLDYYTGTVYETLLRGREGLGSVCSGGRYDALASDGRTSYPGVGLSIGVSRLLVPLLNAGELVASRSTPSCVLVALPDEEQRNECLRIASMLRGRGIPTEVAPEPSKYGKQIRYADRRGIPYVWFPQPAGGEVRDIRSGEQLAADPVTWTPPEEDLRPTIRVNDGVKEIS